MKFISRLTRDLNLYNLNINHRLNKRSEFREIENAVENAHLYAKIIKFRR